MKVSLNWMKQYSNVDFLKFDTDELVRKIGVQLGAVEGVQSLEPMYKAAVIVRIVSCEQHANADRLHVCLVDDGGVTPDVARDPAGLVQVVCGAPNVRQDMLAVWLPPGAVVPNSYASDPFVLEARELRGIVSNGMLASPKELAVSDSHEGLLEVDESAKAGQMFADKYDLNDYIIDIENKMFTHRPDCFGQLGVARELAGIMGQQFVSPDWYKPDAVITKVDDQELPFVVNNQLPELVPRFAAVAMSNITISTSPVWLQSYLQRVGVRPINNVVDLTNYTMLLTGQPLHAYDYDKVLAQDPDAKQATLSVRYAQPDEKLQLLNGRQIEPRSQAILIASATRPIGLAGVMGGADTEVDGNTKNIIIESASFNMYSIRRTSMAHGIFSDAVTRFNKGQSPLQNMAVLARTVAEIQRIAGGHIASQVIDDNHLPPVIVERGSLFSPIEVSIEFINNRLGVHLEASTAAQILRNVEFNVSVDGSQLHVTAPFWRTDIEIAEDVVEEVGRLYGFDKLLHRLPPRSAAAALKDQLLELKALVRSNLSKAGANELLTYSFVHGNLLDKATQNKQLAYQLSNALSPDLQYYRLSLTPSMLSKVHQNIKAGYDEFVLFEIGKVHNTQELTDGVPRQIDALALVVAAEQKIASQKYAGAAYYQAYKYLDILLSAHNISLHGSGISLQPLEQADLYGNQWLEQTTAPYEASRSAVLLADNGLIWGVVGEFKASLRQALKLPEFSAGFELDPLLLLRNQGPRYKPLSRFPGVTQDITLKVANKISYATLYEHILKVLHEEQPSDSISVLPLDIYQDPEDLDNRSITFRITVISYVQTLTDQTVSGFLEKAASAMHNELGAIRI